MTNIITVRAHAPGLEHRENSPEYLKSSGVEIKVILQSHSISFALEIEEEKSLYRRIGQHLGMVETGPAKWDKEQAKVLASKHGRSFNDALGALFEVEWDVEKAAEILRQPVPMVVPDPEEPEASVEASKTQVEVEKTPKCPICSSPMKKRTNKKDDSKFYRCSRYPECKGKVNR